VLVAKQREMHIFSNRPMKMACRFGRIAATPLANPRAHSGALPLNELKLSGKICCVLQN
jgi:hypothetical protein